MLCFVFLSSWRDCRGAFVFASRSFWDDEIQSISFVSWQSVFLSSTFHRPWCHQDNVHQVLVCRTTKDDGCCRPFKCVWPLPLESVNSATVLKKLNPECKEDRTGVLAIINKVNTIVGACLGTQTIISLLLLDLGIWCGSKDMVGLIFPARSLRSSLFKNIAKGHFGSMRAKRTWKFSRFSHLHSYLCSSVAYSGKISAVRRMLPTNNIMLSKSTSTWAWEGKQLFSTEIAQLC